MQVQVLARAAGQAQAMIILAAGAMTILPVTRAMEAQALPLVQALVSFRGLLPFPMLHVSHVVAPDCVICAACITDRTRPRYTCIDSIYGCACRCRYWHRLRRKWLWLQQRRYVIKAGIAKHCMITAANPFISLLAWQRAVVADLQHVWCSIAT